MNVDFRMEAHQKECIVGRYEVNPYSSGFQRDQHNLHNILQNFRNQKLIISEEHIQNSLSADSESR